MQIRASTSAAGTGSATGAAEVESETNKVDKSPISNANSGTNYSQQAIAKTKTALAYILVWMRGDSGGVYDLGLQGVRGEYNNRWSVMDEELQRYIYAPSTNCGAH